MIVEIKSKNPKVEEVLKKITEHNNKDFIDAGFYTTYEKTKNGYKLKFIFTNKSAEFSMTSFLGRTLITRSIKNKLKKIDKNIEVKCKKN